jgi:hypothetical protein
MLRQVETPSSLSLVAVMCDLPYPPALLLESSFDASITDSDEFRRGCQWGYDAYFEDMYVERESETALVFVAKCYTWAEIVEFIIQNTLGENAPGYFISRDWRAGFGLGWLSALALTNQQEAMMGLTMLTALIVAPASDRKSVASWQGVGGVLCC